MNPRQCPNTSARGNLVLRCVLENEHEGLCIFEPPKALEQIADVVLAYCPKSKQPKPRKRRKTKTQACGHRTISGCKKCGQCFACCNDKGCHVPNNCKHCGSEVTNEIFCESCGKDH